MSLALDAKDWDGAKRFHRELVKLEPTSLFVRGELGRELYSRGEYARAEAELKDVVAAAAGDNRALAPALKELGRAQAKAHENAEALATLKRALAAPGAESALRAEIYRDHHRDLPRRPAAPRARQAARGRAPERLRAPRAARRRSTRRRATRRKAIETYRRALGLDPRQIDLRLRMIRLLQANGDLDQAIAEYEALIRAAPDNPQFVFEECDGAPAARRPRTRAAARDASSRRAPRATRRCCRAWPSSTRASARSERSLKVLQRLAQDVEGRPGAPRRPRRPLLPGRQRRRSRCRRGSAFSATVQPRAKALAALGDVYLEHDMTTDALAAYKEAVALEPSNLAYEKALAAAYERTRATARREALRGHRGASAKEKGDKALARECRTRIVTLWGLERILEQQVPALRRQFAANPPDVEAGRMLAEALLHLRRLPDAEATLRQVHRARAGRRARATWRSSACSCRRARSPTPSPCSSASPRSSPSARASSTSAWRSTRSRSTRTTTPSSTRRARSSSTRTTPRATVASARCTARSRTSSTRSPSFARRSPRTTASSSCTSSSRTCSCRRGRPTRPTASFGASCARRPTRSSWRARRACRCRSTSGKGTLESLEQDLLPLAIGNPQRPIYRRLLVEIYGSLTFGLVQRVRHGTRRERDDARAGARAHRGARGQAAARRAGRPGREPAAHRDRRARVRAEPERRAAALRVRDRLRGARAPRAGDDRVRGARRRGARAEVRGAALPEGRARRHGGAGRRRRRGGGVGAGAIGRSEGPSPCCGASRGVGPPPMRALAVLGLGAARDGASVAEIADIARRSTRAT